MCIEVAVGVVELGATKVLLEESEEVLAATEAAMAAEHETAATGSAGMISLGCCAAYLLTSHLVDTQSDACKPFNHCLCRVALSASLKRYLKDRPAAAR